MTFVLDKPIDFSSKAVHPQLNPALTYIVGEPGSGKSTLLSAIAGVQPHREIAKPFAHRLYASGVYELGKRREEFSGTDALSMSVQPEVVSWIGYTGPMRVIAEGDRLGNGSFFDAVEELGYRLTLYVLWGEEAAALQRRIRGSEQDPKWVDGRRAKVRNLMTRPHVELPAGAPIAELIAMMRDPVVDAMRGVR